MVFYILTFSLKGMLLSMVIRYMVLSLNGIRYLVISLKRVSLKGAHTNINQWV